MNDRNLSRGDIDAIVEALEEKQGHTCRFDAVKAEDLEEAIEFYKNVNAILGDTGKTAWQTVVRILVTLGLSAIGVGFYILFKKQGGVL